MNNFDNTFDNSNNQQPFNRPTGGAGKHSAPFERPEKAQHDSAPFTQPFERGETPQGSTPFEQHGPHAERRHDRGPRMGFGGGSAGGFGGPRGARPGADDDFAGFGRDFGRGPGPRRGGGFRGGRGWGDEHGGGFGERPGSDSGPGFGPGFGAGFGPQGGGRRGPGRGRKGDVRAAIIALLGEQPMNGYQLISAISEKSNGLWSPSAGSVYPALGLLEDEGLIEPVETDGKKLFQLTEAGTKYAEENADQVSAPWDRVAGPHKAMLDLRPELHQLGTAVQQVAVTGEKEQIEAAREILVKARRNIYRLLAGDTPQD